MEDQSGLDRVPMSNTNATYAQPLQVDTYVKSATHARFGAAAVKSRSSLSPARTPASATDLWIYLHAVVTVGPGDDRAAVDAEPGPSAGPRSAGVRAYLHQSLVSVGSSSAAMSAAVRRPLFRGDDLSISALPVRNSAGGGRAGDGE